MQMVTLDRFTFVLLKARLWTLQPRTSPYFLDMPGVKFISALEAAILASRATYDLARRRAAESFGLFPSVSYQGSGMKVFSLHKT
jgi:transposase